MSSRWPSTVLRIGAISGRVIDAAGAAVVGASISSSTDGTATTDANGYYTLPTVPAGACTVTISRGGYVTQAKSTTVVDKQTSTLDFTLVTLGKLAGKVTDATANGGKGALAGVTVAIAGDGSTTTGADGSYLVENITAGTRTVTYSKSGYTSQTISLTVVDGQTLIRDVALAPAPVYANLARGKTATASSQRSGYEAAKATDGSTSTRWQSSTGGTQWLKVDLGASKRIDKVVIPWYSTYYARSYRVEVSEDNSTWTSVYSTSSYSSGTKTHSFTSRTARYVRVYCTTANSSSGYSITELEIWGDQ